MKSSITSYVVSSLLFSSAIICAVVSARADTFNYDNAGRLSSVSQSNGLVQTFSPDEEADLLSISVNGSDSMGTGMPDWWQDYYFGGTGVSGTASAANDGISNLAKYALGLNPLVSNSTALLTELFETGTGGYVYPYLTYDCAIAAAASVVLEQSSDGGATWQFGSSYFQQISTQDLGNGTEQITMRCLTPLPQAYGLLFRLQINGDSGSSVVVYVSLSSTPQWWANMGVTNGHAKSDFAIADQGQLKNIATAAVSQLNAALSGTGGAGANLISLSGSWSATSSQTSDYAAVNLGMLKTAAKPFYDRLLAVGYTGVPLISGTYPWVGGSASDFSTANIGEVKNAFSFDPNFTTNPVNPLNWW